MAIELKLVLRSPRSALLLKSLLFFGFLVLAKIVGFGWLAILFFLIASAILFFFPLFQSIPYFISFILFVGLGIFFLKQLSGFYFWVGALGLIAIFYLILGVKNLVLMNRSFLYRIFHLAVFYGVFILFFSGERKSALWLLAIFLVAWLLYRNLFKFQDFVLVSWRRCSVASGVLALLTVEFLWAISFSPIDLVQSATLSLLTVFVLGDLAIKYFNQQLTRKLILADITLFVLLSLFIFLMSRWSL